MKKELIITKEDIKLLKEMKENCLKSSVYDDEKRLLKANAITKFLNLLDTNKNQKEVIDKAIEYVKRNIYSYYDSKGEKCIEETIFERNANPKELLDILKGDNNE